MKGIVYLHRPELWKNKYGKPSKLNKNTSIVTEKVLRPRERYYENLQKIFNKHLKTTENGIMEIYLRKMLRWLYM